MFTPPCWARTIPPRATAIATAKNTDRRIDTSKMYGTLDRTAARRKPSELLGASIIEARRRASTGMFQAAKFVIGRDDRNVRRGVHKASALRNRVSNRS